MTKRTILRWFVAAIAFLIATIVAGILISARDDSQERIAYTTFKDMIPLYIAIPAAWLGYCVQRRSAYVQQLRILWSKLVDAIQSASQYTHSGKPTQQDYLSALTKLSVAIDEVRGLFCNLGEGPRERGLYPFEPIKSIYTEILTLEFGDKFDATRATESRDRIFALWKDVRTELLKEYDREPPTWSCSPWYDPDKGLVYKAPQISTRPT